MKHESLEKFLADARLYFGLEEKPENPAEVRRQPPSMSYRPLSGAGKPEQWSFFQSASQSCRSLVR